MKLQFIKTFADIDKKTLFDNYNSVFCFVLRQMNGDCSIFAKDGSGLYDMFDGDEKERFKTKGGNLIPSGGISVEYFREDLFRVKQRFLGFKDNSGEVLFGKDEVSYKNLLVVVPPIFTEIVENIAVEFGFNYEITNKLIDNNDWFVFLGHPYWKPFVFRKSNTVISGTWSMFNRADKIEESIIKLDKDTGVGIWANFTTIKIVL